MEGNQALTRGPKLDRHIVEHMLIKHPDNELVKRDKLRQDLLHWFRHNLKL